VHFDLLHSSDNNYHALGRLFYVQHVNYISLFFFLWRFGPFLGHSLVSRIFQITVRHITIFRTPANERSVRRRDFYLTIYSTHKREEWMHLGGFEPTIPSKQSVAFPRLTAPDHRDQFVSYIVNRSGNSHIVVTYLLTYSMVQSPS